MTLSPNKTKQKGQNPSGNDKKLGRSELSDQELHAENFSRSANSSHDNFLCKYLLLKTYFIYYVIFILPELTR